MQENIFTDVLQWGGVSFVFIPFLLYLKSLEKHLASQDQKVICPRILQIRRQTV